MINLQKMGLSELDSDTQSKTTGGWIFPIRILNDSLRVMNTLIQGYLDAYETV